MSDRELKTKCEKARSFFGNIKSLKAGGHKRLRAKT